MRTGTFSLALTLLAAGPAPEPYAYAASTPVQGGDEASSPQPLLSNDEPRETSATHAYDTSGLVDTASLSRTNATADQSHLMRAAATAFAASLSASEDTCMRSRSFGLQAIGFGFSLATTWEDVSCRRLHNARALDALGYRDAALDLLCMDKQVRRAMEQAGSPCFQHAGLARSPPPPPAEPAAEPPPIATYAVLFDFDHYNLRPEADQILTPLLATLQADPSMKIDIEGHTDWVGTDAYNLRLSQRRAQAVVNWLVAHGISRDRMRAVGKGEREPIATNLTAAGRQLNRRTEVRRWD